MEGEPAAVQKERLEWGHSGDSGKEGPRASHSRLGPGGHWMASAAPAQPALQWELRPCSAATSHEQALGNRTQGPKARAQALCLCLQG